MDLKAILKTKPDHNFHSEMPKPSEKEDKINMGEHFRSFARIGDAFFLYKKLGTYNTSEMESKRLQQKG